MYIMDTTKLLALPSRPLGEGLRNPQMQEAYSGQLGGHLGVSAFEVAMERCRKCDRSKEPGQFPNRHPSFKGDRKLPGRLCKECFNAGRRMRRRQRPTPKDAHERFWEKVEIDTDCWEWTGARIKNGYGNFWDGKPTEWPIE